LQNICHINCPFFLAGQRVGNLQLLEDRLSKLLNFTINLLDIFKIHRLNQGQLPGFIKEKLFDGRRYISATHNERVYIRQTSGAVT
jgi:hypothetical protein